MGNALRPREHRRRGHPTRTRRKLSERLRGVLLEYDAGSPGETARPMANPGSRLSHTGEGQNAPGNGLSGRPVQQAAPHILPMGREKAWQSRTPEGSCGSEGESSIRQSVLLVPIRGQAKTVSAPLRRQLGGDMPPQDQASSIEPALRHQNPGVAQAVPPPPKGGPPPSGPGGKPRSTSQPAAANEVPEPQSA